MVNLTNWNEIWIIDFEYQAAGGELPEPHCMVGREVFSSRLIRLDADTLRTSTVPPFPTDQTSLVVGYYLPAEFSCFLQLGWAAPVHCLDLCSEYRWLRSGIRDGKRRTLVAALTHFGLVDQTPAEKDAWRQLAIRGAPFSPDEMRGLIDYCQEDVEATLALLEAMDRYIDWPRALLRGQYSWAIANIERRGIPMDVEILHELRAHWDDIKAELIRSVDPNSIVYVDGVFGRERWSNLLARHAIPWPRDPASGHLLLDDDTFRQQAKAHPAVVAPYHELRATLSRLKLNKLAVGSDGRNRTMLSPFVSSTGRNQPSNTKFIFGPSTWIRGLIKPSKGRAIAYIDWSQQELGIAAALSGDEKMKNAYTSGDPYLAFARMAGAVPDGATRQTHPSERAIYKICMLAVQYGMGTKALADQLGDIPLKAKRLLQAHRDTFSQYWRWSERVQNEGFGIGKLQTRFGWQRNVAATDSPASVRNFPVQGNGAEMLRLALMKLERDGIRVIAPIHDAVLVEAEIHDIRAAVTTTQAAMRWASEQILPGFPLQSDVKIVQWPDRYMDADRGITFWNHVMSLIGKPAYSP
jgi:hypothetical protein